MQNLIRLTLLVFILSGCFATTDKYILPKASTNSLAFYPPVPPTLDKAEFQHIYQTANSFYRTTLLPTRFNGGILVAKKGQIVFEEYNGVESNTTREKLDSASSFHLASVSKTFTGMAVLKLWEEGRLGLGDDVSTYIAGFPYQGVTVRSLLNHRSGLPNYVHFMEQNGWDRKKTVYNQDIVNFMIANKGKLDVGRPDRGFNYCNTNYALLALIVEKVSGKAFSSYLQETFFTPLQMNNTFVFSMDQKDEVMPSYNWKNQQEAITFLDAVYGDKNIYSTPRDLLKWDLALTYGKLFKQATLDSAYTGYSNEKPGIKNYGLGWRMYAYPNGKKIIYHNGWWHGNNTVFTRLVQDSATIIVLGNKYNRRIYDAKKMYSAFGGYSLQADGDE